MCLRKSDCFFIFFIFIMRRVTHFQRAFMTNTIKMKGNDKAVETKMEKKKENNFDNRSLNLAKMNNTSI